MRRADTQRRKVAVVAEKSPVVPKSRQTTGDGVYPYDGMRFSAIQCDSVRFSAIICDYSSYTGSSPSRCTSGSI